MDLHTLAKDCKKFLKSLNLVGIKKISATVHRGTIRIGLLMDPEWYSLEGYYWTHVRHQWWERHGKPPVTVVHLERDATGTVVVKREKEIY
jgi:hypothetical protein